VKFCRSKILYRTLESTLPRSFASAHDGFFQPHRQLSAIAEIRMSSDRPWSPRSGRAPASTALASPGPADTELRVAANLFRCSWEYRFVVGAESDIPVDAG
jgi:hypothetical protein